MSTALRCLSKKSGRDRDGCCSTSIEMSRHRHGARAFGDINRRGLPVGRERKSSQACKQLPTMRSNYSRRASGHTPALSTKNDRLDRLLVRPPRDRRPYRRRSGSRWDAKRGHGGKPRGTPSTRPGRTCADSSTTLSCVRTGSESDCFALACRPPPPTG